MEYFLEAFVAVEAGAWFPVPQFNLVPAVAVVSIVVTALTGVGCGCGVGPFTVGCGFEPPGFIRYKFVHCDGI